MFQDLEEIGLDTKDLRLLSELCWKQSAAIRIEGELGRWIMILKGERQGCVTSPDFFNAMQERFYRT